MASVSLWLLGGFVVEANGKSLSAFESNKVRALLAYLAVESGRPHRRSMLAALFWPDHPEALARTNLRHVLRQLRQTLPDENASLPLLLASQQTIQLNPAADYSLDVATFTALLDTAARCTHHSLDDCPDCVERYAQAAALYRGAFLAGLDLHDSDLFDEWMAIQREHLHRQALEAFFGLAAHYERAEQYDQARQYAQRQIEMEPWHEEAHRQLMRVLAQSGQRTAALAQFAACRATLTDELGIEPDTETVALYEAIRDGSLGRATNRRAVAPAPPQPNQTPAPRPLALIPPPVALIGRDHELGAVCQLLRQAELRLLTLTGPGGVGKTGLALQAGHTFLNANDDAFPDGVCFVDLSPIDDGGLVANTLARALAVREATGDSLLARLQEYLRERKLLLILDNFEQVLDAAPQIAELLAACPSLKVLVTSRRALRLRVEHVFPVSVLTPPILVPQPNIATLAANPAVALFNTRAQTAHPQFQLIGANAGAVAEICARLDGLPLAIELAAARIQLLAPSDLLARLSAPQNASPLQLLSTDTRDAPARQQTLYQTIAWSDQLLDPPLQALFARLSVFVGGCRAEAAEAVLSFEFEGLSSTDQNSKLNTLDGLAALLDHSLLRRENGLDGAPRFRMLETIREYALHRLAARGENETLRRAHAAYYLALAETAEPQLQGPDQTAWLDRLEAEHDNLRAALAWCLESSEQEPRASEPAKDGDAPSRQEIGLRLAAALGEFWWPRGHLSEGRRWLNRILDFRFAILEHLETDTSRMQHPKSTIAKALYRAGELAYGESNYGPALALLEESLALYRQLGDKRGMARVLRGLGNTLSADGSERRAVALRAESLTLFRAVGDAWGIAWMLLEIGRTEPDSRRGQELLEESLAVARSGGYKRTIATALGNLGKLAQSQGRYAQASQLLQESVAIGRELRDNWIAAWVLIELGRLATDQGDLERAEEYYQESLALFQEGGNQGGIGVVLEHLDDLRRRIAERADEIGQPVRAVQPPAGAFRTMPLANEPPSRIAPLQDWGEAPIAAYFYGRQTELAQLQQTVLTERCVVMVLGLGGMGKTTLVAKAAKAVAEQFDVVFWRSLVNAPPLTDIVREAIGLLSRQQLSNFPDSLGELLNLLFSYLRQHRCLFVFDNFESVLEAGQAGQYRAGYAEYGRLIERLAQSEHQSCLLITSRERPAGTQRLADEGARVRFLPLDGLEEQAGQALLRTRGLEDGGDLAVHLVERYSGNPLALKLVARTIEELFDGDIAAFLGDETLIFDDIRTVLDQQFARLSRLEREILIWLAIEREGLALQDLAQDLVRAPSRRELLEALRALQRRSLLEKTATLFTLQNVVMEYVTDVVVARACVEFQNGQLELLSNYALLRAQSRQSVRQSQRRLILQPIARRLLDTFGSAALERNLEDLLAQLRSGAPLAPGYAAGNILNLLIHIGADLHGYSFARLNVWQVDLREVVAPQIDFTGADLSGCAFTGTFGLIYSIAYSPDGHLLAVGAGDGKVHLWRMSDHQPFAVCQGHSKIVRGVAFSPDSQLLVTGSHDQTIRIWDARTCQLLHTLRGHTDWVEAVAFSPDGQVLASGSHDRSVRLWHVQERRILQTLRGHTDWVRTLAFSPDGQVLASGSADGTIRLWEVATGQLRALLPAHDTGVTSVAWSADGHTLASSGSDRMVRLWDIATGQVRHSLAHSGSVHAIAFASDNRTLASGGSDRTVRLWDVATGAIRHGLIGHTNEVRDIAVSPDGNVLASVGADQTIRMWDVQSGQARQTLQGHINAIWSVAFNPNPAHAGELIASGGDDQRVRIWDLRTRQVWRTLHGHVGDVQTVAFSPDGHLLASGAVDQTVRLWDVATGQAYHTLHGHTQAVWSVAFSPDGQLLASASEDQTVRLWDVRALEIRHTLHGHTGVVRSAAFSPDGQLLASASEDQTICLWEVHTGQVRSVLRGHTHWLRAVAFSPDGQWLASSGADQTVRLWDVRRGELRQILEGHSDIVISVAFSPDGAALASCSSDRTVRVWDTRTGRPRHVLHDHGFWVRSVAWSADGRTLASGSADETIKLWDTHTGECLLTLRADGPYAGMKIANATGITSAQRAALKVLGALE